MRLLVDLQCVQSALAGRGVGRYALALTRELARHPAHRVEALLAGGGRRDALLAARRALETFLPAGQVHVFDPLGQSADPHAPPRRAVAEAVHAAAVRSLAPDALLLGTGFPSPQEAVLSAPEHRLGVPTAAILYDLMPALDPGGYLVQGSGDDYRRRCADLARADLLLAISEHTAGQAEQVFGRAQPPTAVVHGGAYPSGAFPSLEGGASGTALPPAPYLLTVGGDHPRKNLDLLVRAWGRTGAARQGARLVVACRLTEGTRRRLERIARQQGLRDDALVLLGAVAEADLDLLYRQAEGFVFASLEEGLGLPPLEAMHRGCPTLMARGSSLSELSDDPASYVDGQDVTDVARGLDALLSDEELRDRLRAAGARTTSRITFARSAELAWQALEPLAARAAPAPGGPLVARPLADAQPGQALVLPRAAAPEGQAGEQGREEGGELGQALAALGVTGIVPPPHVARAWAAPAVVAPDDDRARDLVASGLVDVPVVVDGGGQAQAWLARAGQQDLYRLVRELLDPASLGSALADELVAALSAAPRWTLDRPWPVWLLLTDDDALLSAADRLRGVAREEGVVLVVAAPAAVPLAGGCDRVLVAVREPDLLAPGLLGARLRGAVVTALTSPGGTAAGGEDAWWGRAPLPATDDDWRRVLRSSPRCTTGWSAHG
jgi:glycosyltransferase involved in cell wall biosynthesis